MPSKSLKSEVITRIAPSPTGPFHVGTARTALFNYLFARGMGGKFLLRIEDTDQERSDPKSTEEIVEGLTWLELAFDQGIVYQSMRRGAYEAALRDLRESGWAYEKDRAWYFRVLGAAENRAVVEFDDLIRGHIRVKLNELEDFVLVRSDGTPLFLFAGVVDDAAMEVSHVIRGDDHISNTPRQILIHEALGLTTPQYAHIPLILASDRSKLSKRHGATSLIEYRRMGYLPEAMVNFLALLGWHPKDEREFFSLEELVAEFSLDRVQKGGAVFDTQKLDAINRHYIRTVPDERLQRLLIEDHHTTHEAEQVRAASPLVRDRMSRLSEFESLTGYLWDRPSPGPKQLVFKKSTPETTHKGLALVVKNLELVNSTDWTEAKLKALLEDTTRQGELQPGDVFWPVRVALSGLEASPPPEALLVALGKDEALHRIQVALGQLS